MRIVDLFEDIGGDLEQDLNDLLAIAKGNGLTEIDTNRVVMQLSAMGYAVSPETLVQLIQKGGQATDASLEKITLASNMAADGQDSAEDSQEKVEQMAITSGMKGIKQ